MRREEVGDDALRCGRQERCGRRGRFGRQGRRDRRVGRRCAQGRAGGLGRPPRDASEGDRAATAMPTDEDERPEGDCGDGGCPSPPRAARLRPLEDRHGVLVGARAVVGRRVEQHEQIPVEVRRRTIGVGDRPHGTQRDGGLRVGVDRDRAVEALRQQLGDPGDARRAAGQQDRCDVLRHHVRGLQEVRDDVDRPAETVLDHLLELSAREPDDRVPGTQEDEDHGVGVERERLLGLDGLATERGEPGTGIPLGREIVERQTCRAGGVPEHRIVEVRATEASRPTGSPTSSMLRSSSMRTKSGVEGAAAQVVHGEQDPGSSERSAA